jgi:hypothetical protein
LKAALSNHEYQHTPDCFLSLGHMSMLLKCQSFSDQQRAAAGARGLVPTPHMQTTAEIAGIKDRRKKHTYTLFNLWAPAIGLRKDYCEKLL